MVPKMRKRAHARELAEILIGNARLDNVPIHSDRSESLDIDKQSGLVASLNNVMGKYCENAYKSND